MVIPDSEEDILHLVGNVDLALEEAALTLEIWGGSSARLDSPSDILRGSFQQPTPNYSVVDMRHSDNQGRSRIDTGSQHQLVFSEFNGVVFSDRDNSGTLVKGLAKETGKFAGNVVAHHLDGELKDLVASYSVSSICNILPSKTHNTICKSLVSYVSYQFIQEAKVRIQKVAHKVFEDTRDKRNAKLHSGCNWHYKMSVLDIVEESQKDDPVLNCFDLELLCQYTKEACDLECAGYTPESLCTIM